MEYADVPAILLGILGITALAFAAVAPNLILYYLPPPVKTIVSGFLFYIYLSFSIFMLILSFGLFARVKIFWWISFLISLGMFLGGIFIRIWVPGLAGFGISFLGGFLLSFLLFARHDFR